MYTLRDFHSSPVVCPPELLFLALKATETHTDEVRERRGCSPEPECVQQEQTWAARPGARGCLSLGRWHLRCCEGRKKHPSDHRDACY